MNHSPHQRTSRLGYLGRLAGFLLLSLVVAYLAISYYLASTMADSYLAPLPGTITVPDDLPFAVESITFTGTAGTLSGWWVAPQQPDAPVIVLLPGYGGDRLGMRWHAEQLAAAGYGLLLYDPRGVGESAGEQRSYGWADLDDVGSALDFLHARGMTRIGMVGCSIGAQITVRAMAAYPTIAGAVADGPSIVATGDLPPPQYGYDWLSLAMNLMLDAVIAERTGLSQPPLVRDVIADTAPRPLLIISGGREIALIGTEAHRNSYYLEFARDNVQQWIIPEASHCDGPAVREDDYRARLLGFFDDLFGG